MLEEKKGENILILDISDISDFTDYFVICSGNSIRTLDALADEVTYSLRKDLKIHGKLEGAPQDGWIVIDYGNIVVHLFIPEIRDYYRLEELWSSGKILLQMQ